MRALAGALLLAAGPAVAQPLLLPTRDVDVTYRSDQGGQLIEQRSRFSAAAQRMRVDLPTPGLYTIMDYRSRRMLFVSDPDRAAIETQPGLPEQGPSAYTRHGQDRVAGLDCTDWQAPGPQTAATFACFTADGVMLRARQGGRVLAQATRVAYAPQPAALFSAPPGYDVVQRKSAP